MARYIHKFGRNNDVDAAEDIWIAGGSYSFPSAAAVTTVASTTGNDTSTGTGARTIRVFGLDSDWEEIQEDVTMNGTNSVTLANNYFRVNRAYVLTAGSGGVNAGNIDVKHGATVLARIPASMGQTQQAIYTTPADNNKYRLIHWYASVATKISTGATMAIKIRTNAGPWRVIEIQGITESAPLDYEMYTPVMLDPKTDILLTALAVAASNTDIAGGFDLYVDELK